MLADEIEGQLVQRRLTNTGFSLVSLGAAARDLGREPRFIVELFHEHCIVIPSNSEGFLDRIDQVARGANRSEPV
jgi:hypothetical protein